MGLEWAIIVVGGLVAGFLASPAWKAVLGLSGLGVAFLATSLVWGNVRGLLPAALLILEGGQLSQLVAVAYACALAALITAVRTRFTRNHAT